MVYEITDQMFVQNLHNVEKRFCSTAEVIVYNLNNKMRFHNTDFTQIYRTFFKRFSFPRKRGFISVTIKMIKYVNIKQIFYGSIKRSISVFVSRRIWFYMFRNPNNKIWFYTTYFIQIYETVNKRPFSIWLRRITWRFNL